MALTNVFPNNKWGKTSYLNRHKELRAYLPDTARETQLDLYDFLNKYKMVYVKPNHGTGGHGVMRVELARDGKFKYQLKSKVREFDSFDSMYASLSRFTSERKHIVQKGIRMIKYQKRPFDIRIMVQKNLKGEWVNTGIIGRIAHPQRIVTNYHCGGTPIEVETLLKPHMGAADAERYIRNLNKLGLEIAKYLHTGYPFLTAVGVDVGIDADFYPWIFEVNSKPDPYIFKRLKNAAVFRRIIRYIRAHRALVTVFRLHGT